MEEAGCWVGEATPPAPAPAAAAAAINGSGLKPALCGELPMRNSMMVVVMTC